MKRGAQPRSESASTPPGTITHTPRPSPRKEHLQSEKLRVEASPSLSHKFPGLKSLTVDLGHFAPDGISRHSQIKYTVNVEHAKSVFCIACHNHECVRGNFDLSAVLARAVGAHKTSVSGELRCQGWRNRAGIDSLRCDHILRYRLTLGY